MPNVENKKPVASESALTGDDRWCSIMWFDNEQKRFSLLIIVIIFFSNIFLSGAFMLCNQNKTNIYTFQKEKEVFVFSRVFLFN